MRTRLRAVLTAALFFAGADAAMAASPVGHWSVRFFSEPGLTPGATQDICVLPDGTWVSDTFSGWQGTWFQEGDSLRWNGTTGAILTSAFGAFDSIASSGG